MIRTPEEESVVFLEEPPRSPDRDATYAEDIAKDGFVWTLTRLWAWNPKALDLLQQLLDEATEAGSLSFRDRGVIVTATASSIANSGCALAWGNRLSKAADVDTAVNVLKGEETETMTERDRVLSRWARDVATDPTSTTEADVEDLRRLGLSDAEIHAITLYIGLRIAYSTVNDALDVPLDLQLVETFPEEVVNTVDFGRASR